MSAFFVYFLAEKSVGLKPKPIRTLLDRFLRRRNQPNDEKFEGGLVFGFCAWTASETTVAMATALSKALQSRRQAQCVRLEKTIPDGGQPQFRSAKQRFTHLGLHRRFEDYTLQTNTRFRFLQSALAKGWNEGQHVSNTDVGLRNPPSYKGESSADSCMHTLVSATHPSTFQFEGGTRCLSISTNPKRR